MKFNIPAQAINPVVYLIEEPIVSKINIEEKILQ